VPIFLNLTGFGLVYPGLVGFYLGFDSVLSPIGRVRRVEAQVGSGQIFNRSDLP
jgi:hypothetical protein